MGYRRDEEKALANWVVGGVKRGPDYAPYHTVRTVPSRGVAHRFLGLVTGRVHHCHSTVEYHCLLTLDWQDGVTDLREQYALHPLEETLQIAAELGVRHPSFAGQMRVMTTDVVVSRSGPLGSIDEAVAVKMAGDLSNRRVLEKLEIERRYWAARGVRWGLVTEHELPWALVENLKFVCPRRDLTDFPLSNEEAAALLPQLGARLLGAPSEPLYGVCIRADDSVGLPTGTSLSLLRHAIAMKRWRVDMFVKIDPQSPLTRLELGIDRGRCPMPEIA